MFRKVSKFYSGLMCKHMWARLEIIRHIQQNYLNRKKLITRHVHEKQLE